MYPKKGGSSLVISSEARDPVVMETTGFLPGFLQSSQRIATPVEMTWKRSALSVGGFERREKIQPAVIPEAFRGLFYRG